MSLDSAPLLLRKSVIAAELETTTGTAATLEAADAAFNVYNVNFAPDIVVDDRPAAGTLGHLAPTTGPRTGRLTFETDFCGSGATGAVPTWANKLLRGCGMTEASTNFTFADPTAQQTVTIGFYHNGGLKRLVGAQGTFTITLNSGRAGRIAFEFAGSLDNYSDASLLTPTLPSVIPPRFANTSALTVHSVTNLRVATVTITAGNELQPREDANSPTGVRTFAIVDRRSTITLDPEMVLVGSTDWHARFRESTTGNFSAIVGTAANNTITTTAASTALIDLTHGDRNKKLIDSLGLLVLNNGLTIDFT